MIMWVILLIAASILATSVLWFGKKKQMDISTSVVRGSDLVTKPTSQLSFSSRDELDDAQAIDPQILFPFSAQQTNTKPLFALGCSLKNRYGDNPIRLLTIIEGQDNENVAESTNQIVEKQSQIAERSESINTAVETETIEGNDIPLSITQTAEESDDDLILMGWSPCADRFTNEARYECIVDQVLVQTRLPVYILQLKHQLSTTSHLHLIIPKKVDHHGGFYESIYNVKQLAEDIDVPVTVYVFEKNIQQYRTLFDLVEVDIFAEFVSIESWKALWSKLATQTQPTDIVISLAVREEEIGWTEELEAFPKRCSDLSTQSFALFFLREDKPEYDNRFLRTE